MEIQVRGKTITSVYFSVAETAWSMEDALLVLEYLQGLQKVVLGGDILTKTLEYTYDNWYYEPKPQKDVLFNSKHSIRWAQKYLTRYIKRNGSGYYVVFVVENEMFL